MKIISGGQTGADFAGLKAAKDFGFETGGMLPKNCRTLDGPRPEFLTEYNMVEHTSYSYVPRTEANVRDSDGTIRFASNFKSNGEKCTLKAIKWFNRPYIDVDIKNPRPVEEVINFIKQNNIQILNVAGNSELTSPGITETVYNYLINVFKGLKNDQALPKL